MAKWLDKYDAPKAQNGIEGTMGGLTDKGFNYNGAWGGPSMQMGGTLQPPMAGAVQTVPMAQMGGYVYSTTFVPQAEMGTPLPGSVGFTYARTKGIPSEGPYGKKTVPSAQNGQEMQFYQNGLDWTPRNISEYGSEIPMAQPGITQPMRGDIQTRGNQNLLTEIAAQRTKEKKAQEARTRTTIGADKRTAKQKEKDREFTEQINKRRKEMGLPEGTGYLTDRKKADKILSKIMTPLEAASYITGAGSIGSNFLRLGASTLEKQIGKNLVSKGLKNATSYANPIINKADEALAYAQLDPIGIMGNKLNTNLYNPTTAINRASNTITGIDKNLKNSAVETADLIVGENNTEILFDKIINPLPDNILNYINDSKPPLFIRALGKIVPPGTSIVAPGLYAQVLNQSLSEEDKSKLPTLAKEHLEKMANQFNIDSKLKQKKKGGVVKDNMGYWNPDNWGKVVEIDSPNITMKGVNQDLIGVSDEGDVQYMTPGNDYTFEGNRVTEYPVAKYGVNQQDEKTVQHLDQLLNFTNKPKAKNGWLDKYK
jgi:hypothetical protein